MAERPDNLTLNTQCSWVSSSDFRTFSQSSPLSPDTQCQFSSSPITEDHQWRSKVASCRVMLSNPNSSGQGVVLFLGIPDRPPSHLAGVLGVSSTLALLTNHHVIPRYNDIRQRKIKLQIAGDSKLHSLSADKIISCCGVDGIWSQQQHNHPTPCPVGADFSLVLLSADFADSLSKIPKLLFPSVMPLDTRSLEQALKSKQFFLFCLQDDHTIVLEEEIDLTMQHLASPSDDQRIESQIQVYQGMCNLKYGSHHSIIPGTSGAGIYFKEGSQRTLIGMHTSTDENRSGHNGITIHKIFHAIAGGEVCGLIPCLSLIKESHDRKKLEAKWYFCLTRCLETGQHTPVQPSCTEDNQGDVTFGTQLKAIYFLLKLTNPDIFPLRDETDPLTLPSVKLLEALFHCFNIGHSAALEKIREVFEDEAADFCKRVVSAGERVMCLLGKSQNKDLVEACFSCWRQMFYFPDARFKDACKLSTLKRVRDEDRYQRNSLIHRAYGDVSDHYRAYLRENLNKQHQEEIAQRDQAHTQRLQTQMQQHNEEIEARLRTRQEELEAQRHAHQEELEARLRTRQEELEAQRHAHQEELEAQHHAHQEELEARLHMHQEELDKLTEKYKQEIDRLKRKVQEPLHTVNGDKSPCRSNTTPAKLNCSGQSNQESAYPTRDYSDTVVKDDRNATDFWNKDVCELLNKDVKLRDVVSGYFRKVGGSTGSSTWERLLVHLKEDFGFSMDSGQLEKEAVSEIIKNILEEWRKYIAKPALTIESFCMYIEEKLEIRALRGVFKKAEAGWLATLPTESSNAQEFDNLQHSLLDKEEVRV